MTTRTYYLVYNEQGDLTSAFIAKSDEAAIEWVQKYMQYSSGRSDVYRTRMLESTYDYISELLADKTTKHNAASAAKRLAMSIEFLRKVEG